MRRMRFLWLGVFALLILGAFAYTSAQQRDVTCPRLIEEALGAIGDNCAGLGRNSACYGFHNVNATFSETTAADFFTEPSDRADLVTVKNIGTTPMDTASQQWGIALLSLQANLPDTLPGQNTIFMLLGDTEIENAVQPEKVFQGGATVDVTTRAAAGLFYRPDASDEIVSAIPVNTTLPADARTEDSAWVRVVFEDVPGWVTREVLTAPDDLDPLPVMAPDMQSPMQSFYLRTGISGTECTEAPDSLVVQGPQSLMVDINVNGADIRLGSTIALRLVPLDPTLAALFEALYGDISNVVFLMELVVIDGEAILDPNTEDELIVPEGYRTVRCLSDENNLGLDGLDNDREVFPACPWLTPDLWRESDYELYDALEGLRLNYRIRMPEPPQPTATPSPTNTPRPYVPPPATLTPTNTATATNTQIVEQENTLTPTNTATATATATNTEIIEETGEVFFTDTPTSTNTPTDVPTSTPTDTPKPTDTPTDAPTSTPTDTPKPTDTPTNIPQID